MSSAPSAEFIRVSLLLMGMFASLAVLSSVALYWLKGRIQKLDAQAKLFENSFFKAVFQFLVFNSVCFLMVLLFVLV